MCISSIFNTQHDATRHNRVAKRAQHVASTLLRNIVLKYCDRWAGASKCWANSVGICFDDVLRSFGQGLMYCRNIISIKHMASDVFVAFRLVLP